MWCLLLQVFVNGLLNALKHAPNITESFLGVYLRVTNHATPTPSLHNASHSRMGHGHSSYQLPSIKSSRNSIVHVKTASALIDRVREAGDSNAPTLAGKRIVDVEITVANR